MRYRQLGGSGLWVSEVGMGGNTFGRYADETQTAVILRRALDLGVNHFDTAELYNKGLSESYVGKALAEHRHKVVIATKVGFPVGEGLNEQGLSHRRVMAACEGSLKRLKTDYIDLYYLHRPDPATPMEETLRAFDDLVRQGKVRYVGVSNYQAWQVCEALWISDRRGYLPVVATQNSYNLIDRNIEPELVPFCRSHKVGIVPYAPLSGGVLTGKYRRNEPIPPGTRGFDQEKIRQRLNDRNFRLIEGLESFARQRGRGLGELAIAWLLSHPEVSSVIIGATKPEQVEANVAAAEWQMSPEELRAVEEILAST